MVPRPPQARYLLEDQGSRTNGKRLRFVDAGCSNHGDRPDCTVHQLHLIAQSIRASGERELHDQLSRGSSSRNMLLRVVAREKRPRRANEAPLKAANDYDCFAAWLERDDCLNVDA